MSLFERLARVRQARETASPGSPPVKKPLQDGLGGREVKTAWGSYYLVEIKRPGNFSFPRKAGSGLLENLRLVLGIGPVTEGKLRECGYQTLADLCRHPRWQEEAHTCLELIARRDFAGLRRRGASDWEILEFFRPEDLVFLDIETTGLWCSQPLFLVGILYWREGHFTLKQFLARHYREERALLAALLAELPAFQVVVTYNGKKFDIPYIEGRTVAHGLYYRFEHEQLDLLYHARRCYRGLLPNCRLVTVEEGLLNLAREDDIPGHQIPQVYHHFVQTQEPPLMKKILEHNAQDLFSLAHLLPLLMEEEICREMGADGP
ncbi:MAG: ribonuclease H-like domain-containing protein [bacterium]|jgi:uncharacterized protein YprB with RNaseH-like and TPR domain|nr:ribonuclease H-like domain-containing protein [Bacillota bacterium]HHW55515.1 hypothetical protein [Bacillota bacterium]